MNLRSFLLILISTHMMGTSSSSPVRQSTPIPKPNDNNHQPPDPLLLTLPSSTAPSTQPQYPQPPSTNPHNPHPNCCTYHYILTILHSFKLPESQPRTEILKPSEIMLQNTLKKVREATDSSPNTPLHDHPATLSTQLSHIISLIRTQLTIKEKVLLFFLVTLYALLILATIILAQELLSRAFNMCRATPGTTHNEALHYQKRNPPIHSTELPTISDKPLTFSS